MNERKQHVIKMAHQLFIDKGFQATSIQDILDYSGISKGTFYNYFPSKNELLIALFKTIYKKVEKERNQLLIGQDPSDIEIFIKQIELQMITNKENKLITLFEEVHISQDEDLKQYLKENQLRMLRWLNERFLDIFGTDKKPYLLDCSIMFMGILHQNTRYYMLAYESGTGIHQVVRYSVNRMAKIVNEVAEADEQLISPEFLDNWLPDLQNGDQLFQHELIHTVSALKRTLSTNKDQTKYIELLHFIQDELLHTKNPREFLIESVLLSLKAEDLLSKNETFNKLIQLIENYFI